MDVRQRAIERGLMSSNAGAAPMNASREALRQDARSREPRPCPPAPVGRIIDWLSSRRTHLWTESGTNYW
jgi:hypothetical protein